MKKFTYKLQNLLNVKVKLEDQAKTNYGNMIRVLQEEQQVLQELYDKKLQCENTLKELMQGKLDILELKLVKEGLHMLTEHIKAQKVKVKNAEHRVEVARIRLANAMIERKTQEKLKEKAFEQYKIEFDSEEQKEIDERNSFKFQEGLNNEEDE